MPQCDTFNPKSGVGFKFETWVFIRVVGTLVFDSTHLRGSNRGHAGRFPTAIGRIGSQQSAPTATKAAQELTSPTSWDYASKIDVVPYQAKTLPERTNRSSGKCPCRPRGERWWSRFTNDAALLYRHAEEAEGVRRGGGGTSRYNEVHRAN